MDRLAQYRQQINLVFERYRAEGAIAICDEKTDNYLLMNVGWQGYQREYGVFFTYALFRMRFMLSGTGQKTLSMN